MDEEEELENTLIGQEEAPAVNTEGALMGSIPGGNLVSFVNTTGQQSDLMNQLADTASANIGVPMTGMRPIDPATGQPRSEEFLQRAEDAGVTNLLAQASVPLPQTPSALPEVVADQPQAAVNPFLQAPIAPMGPEETRARLGGMTLNQYLNAPAGDPDVSGLRTDPQGRMISNIGRFQARPPASALSDFEQASIERQQRIGGTGSFAGDSQAMQDRLRDEERRPDETQTERDTRVAQSRIDGGQTRVLSFDDARRRAEGELAARGIRNPSVSQVNALARSIQAAEPERLEALKTQRFKDELSMTKDDVTIETGQAALDDAESFNKSISNSTSTEGVVDYNNALFEYVRRGGNNRSYLEFLRKGQELAKEAIDAGRKPEIKVIQIGGFNVLTQDGKFMTATTIGGGEVSTSAIRTIEGKIQLIEDAEKDYFSGDPERIKRAERTITALDIKNNEFGGQSTAKDYFGFGALTGNDYDAYNFAINNPNDPRSKEMLERLRKEAEDAEN